MIEGWEGWHLYHLARRAKVFGVEKPLIDALEKAGWALTKDKPLPESLQVLLEKALERVGSIPKFEKTCEDIHCPICHYVVASYSRDVAPSKPWELTIELYKWQKEAKKKWWETNGRGIVKVVTGAGKTILALSLLSDLVKSEAYRDGGLKTVIIAPTTVLLDQWLVALMDKLNITRDEIAVFYGKEKDLIENKKIVIYVVNSARTALAEHYNAHFRYDEVFLIADECHRYGSKENSKIFDIPLSYTLGLSATPERFGDMGFEKKIAPNLGEIIFSYTYNDALIDGVIPPYKLTRVKVRLTKDELDHYSEFSEKISKLSKILFSKYPTLKECDQFNFIKKLGLLYEETQDSTIIRYTSLLNQRKEIIHLSRSKLNALKWLIENENLKDQKILLFHERIEVADEMFNFLEQKGFNVGIYHTGLSLDDRIRNIADYRKGIINVLVSCRALDEGFDVPESEVGIIVAGTSSVRQWIQRMGRILRRTPEKEYSRIYVVFADVIEKDVFRETELRDFEKEAVSVELIDLTYQ